MLNLIDNCSNIFIMFSPRRNIIATGKYRPPNFVNVKAL